MVYGEAGKRECTKNIATQRNIFGIWERPLRVTAPCHRYLESSFHAQHVSTLKRIDVI